VSRRLTWSLILGVALSLSAMLATSDQDAITSLLRHDFGALTLKTALIVCAGGLLLVVAYTSRYELGDVGDRVIAQLMPGHVAGHGRNAEVVRGTRGDFAVAAHINGAKVPMVVDTGATSVVLTYETARAAGLPLELLDYNVDVETAGGHTKAARLTLDRLAIGKMGERSVPALVVPHGKMKTNLLGMSFLDRLERLEVRADKLKLHGYQ
jgi:aspartyl protease family protein